MKIASEGFLKEKGNVEPTVINQEQRIKTHRLTRNSILIKYEIIMNIILLEIES